MATKVKMQITTHRHAYQAIHLVVYLLSILYLFPTAVWAWAKSEHFQMEPMLRIPLASVVLVTSASSFALLRLCFHEMKSHMVPLSALRVDPCGHHEPLLGHHLDFGRIFSLFEAGT